MTGRWLATLTAACIGSSLAASPPDGTVVARAGLVPEAATYAAFEHEQAKDWQADPHDPPFNVSQFQEGFPQSSYRLLVSQREVRAETITYISDGLKIAGFIVRPRPDGRRHPVILYARGGNRDFGKIDMRLLIDFAAWAKHGYIVLASQNRGTVGSEGRDEFGGADVDDFKNLVQVARGIADADVHNLFAYGHSRGSITVLEALRDGLPVRAAAVTGVVGDLANMSRSDGVENMWAELMPDYAADKANGFCRRSAVCWADRIKVPLQLQGGTADWRADPATQILPLVIKMQAARADYELVMYEGDDHRFGIHRAEALGRVIRWFDMHAMPPR